MTPDDILMYVVLVFISGLLGIGAGYLIRDFQMLEYMKEVDESMKELNALADIIREEREDAD